MIDITVKTTLLLRMRAHLHEALGVRRRQHFTQQPQREQTDLLDVRHQLRLSGGHLLAQHGAQALHHSQQRLDLGEQAGFVGYILLRFCVMIWHHQLL